MSTALTHRENWIDTLVNWRIWAPPSAMAVFLIVVAQYDFLTFHTLAELFAIVISFIMFALAWSTHDFSKNFFLLFLACGYFWIGSLDLMHTLLYKGMSLFVEGNGNLAVQFWIGTRYAEALLLFAAPFAAVRTPGKYKLFIFFGIIASSLTILILNGNFPTGFVEGKGLTDFKIASEYLIVFILALALLTLWRYGDAISSREKTLITASIIMTMAAELFFTFYVSVYGLSNLAGHILKLFSFWFIFHAVILLNLKKPYADFQESEERYQRAAQIAKLGYYVWDEREGKAVLCSAQLAAMHGVSVEEFYRRSSSLDGYLEWIHPEDRDQLEQLSLQAAADCAGYEIDYRIIRDDGEVRWLHELAEAILDDNGQLIQTVGTLQDITDEKLVEETLQRSQRLEAVGQLTGGIAHDFNNLMGVIIGNAEMLKDKIGNNATARPNVEAIIKAVDRGASLTQRLLAFSRQQTLSPRPTAINILIVGLENMLQRSLGETMELRTHLDPEIHDALIDAHQFESALINLAINARDAMPNGGKLTIKTSNITLNSSYTGLHDEVNPGDYVKVSVSDTGTGMSAEVLEKVFEPFYTTKGVGEGSGLGLSMVYGFVKQSNGHVTVHSEQGQGTVINLYMPRSRGIIPELEDENHTAVLARGSERILVVEDDEDVRDILTVILKEQGYETIEAQDGKEAISHLQGEGQFDLLFTDVVLPGGMNGMEIAQQAARLQSGIKVLYTSGYAKNAAVEMGLLEPGISVVRKPYNREKMLAKVRMILDSTDN